MKTSLSISLICFGLFLNTALTAQSVSEIKFDFSDHHLNTAKNLISVSTFIATKQATVNGIHFTLVVKNNSDKFISVKNVAEQLQVILTNERGLNISVPNNSSIELQINRRVKNVKWKFSSESIVPDQAFINGRKDNVDIKAQEYTQIPAGGDWKINLTLKNVKQVNTPEDVINRGLKPTKILSPGKYILQLILPIISAEQNISEGFSGQYISPFINIEYMK